MVSILIIDDDKAFCGLLAEIVGDLGHEVALAHDIRTGLAQVEKVHPDVVFLDVFLPDGNGLDALPDIMNSPSQPEVIIITAQGDPDGAELAVNSGAWDYIAKPSSLKQMTLPLIRALEFRKEKKAKRGLTSLRRDSIIGSGPRIMACLDLVAEAASSEANVLIYGETGTGKELFALAIHNNSGRREKNFVVVDCAALPETLVESLLFGHEKGAFTGADRAKDGLVKQADGGVLFLDEIGELPLSLQKSFLRVLQEHRFRRLGGTREIECDFRLVAATNRNLDQMVKDGRFRNDLLFRLRSFTIELPALRERPEDIEELTVYHLARICQRYGMGTKGFSPEFIEALAAYHWPGNVRELVNTLERLVASNNHTPTLLPHHLPTEIRARVARNLAGPKSTGPKPEAVQPRRTRPLPRLREVVDSTVAEVEREYLQGLMDLTDWDIKEACQTSGLSRTGLYDRLKKYDISKDA